MRSLILQTATRYLLPLLMLFSVFLLFIGHNKPGGGFVGGLMAAGGVILSALAFDTHTARCLLPVAPEHLLGGGLLTAAISGVWGLVSGEPFLTSVWGNISIFGSQPIKIGTPLLFDIGVYFTVIGGILMILLALAEEGGEP